MIGRKSYKKTSIWLVIFLIISIFSSYATADIQALTTDEPEAIEEKEIIPMETVLFSASKTKDLVLAAPNMCISGNIHSNAGIRINAQNFKISGLISAVKGHEFSGPPINSSNFIDNAPVVELPDMSNRIDDLYGKKLIHIYPDDYQNIINDQYNILRYISKTGFEMIGSKHFTVNSDTVYFFHGNINFTSGVKIIGNGTIIATGDINIINLDTSNGSAFVYSTSGNISCNCPNAKLNATFYAPKGSFYFTGHTLDITGSIIADTILSFPADVRITAPNRKNIDETPIPSPTPTPSPNANLADVNGDKVVNMSDVIRIALVFNSSKGDNVYVESCDLNRDGAINMIDVMVIAKNFNIVIAN